MATLDDIRAKVPSLQGLDDEQALRYLEQRYQVPAATIARNLGVKMPEPVAPPAPKRSLFAVANDTVIEAANAAAGTAGSIANFVSPGNRFSQGVDEFIREGEASQSDAVKADKARFRGRMESAQGVGDELAAVGGYIADAPLQALAQAAGSIAVPGAAIKAAGALGGGAKTGLAIGAGIGGAGAGGDAAGTAYELAKEAGASDEEATAAARSASVIPGIVGAAGGVIGAERLLAGAKGFGGNAAARALKTGAVEAGQEGFEEGITQYEGQRAAVPFDPTIDPMKGVAGAAAMGAALGGAAGGGVSLISPAPADVPDKKAEADAALTALGSAGSVDEAVALATKATDIPVLPTRDPNSAKMVKARNAGTLAWVRDLEREDQTTALGLMALLGNPRTPETVRRSVSGQLDALERKARAIPTGEASEVLPTGDVFDDQDIPAGEATELRTGMAIDGQNVYDPDLTWEQRRERLRRAAGLPPAMESTELLPTGEATEADPIPAGDAFEDIPTADAAEVLPVGDAAEVLPTPDVIEDAPPLPTGEATDIEPEQADTELLLTADNMPYGTRAGAYVRAKREGLTPDAVVEVPGGWAVKKESDGERGQPDVAGTPGATSAAGAGRAPEAVGSGVAVGRVAADAGGREPAATAGTVAGGGQAGAAGSGTRADPALTVEALSKQWADAVARGDMAEAKRLNDAIVEARKPKEAPKPAEPEVQERIDGEDGMYVNIVKSTRKAGGFNVVLRDGDSEQTAGVVIVPTIEAARAKADEMLGKKPAPIDTSAGPVEAAGGSGQVAADAALSGNGFIPAPNGYKVRVTRHQSGSNVLDPVADIGAFVYEVRKGDGDLNPLTMVVNKDGKLVAAKSVLTNNKSNGTAWVPKSQAAADAVQSLLEQRAGTEVGSAARKAIDAKIAEAVAADQAGPTGGATSKRTTPNAAAPAQTPAASEELAAVPEAAAPDANAAEMPDSAPAPAPTNPPAPAPQTRPQELIELRKRAAVLKQLLRCLL